MTSLPEERQVEWRAKLSAKRKGRKPALGMKHTEASKELFRKVSREYWSTQDTYDWDDMKDMPFKQARDKYGISKTHYHRLRKRSKANDLA